MYNGDGGINDLVLITQNGSLNSKAQSFNWNQIENLTTLIGDINI